MSPAQAVKDVIAADSVLVSYVGKKIYPLRVPDAVPAPFVVVTGISEDVQGTFEANTAGTLRASRVQVDCYHKQYDSAQAMAEAAEYALERFSDADGLRAFKIDVRDLFEDDTLLHRVSMDFTIWRGR